MAERLKKSLLYTFGVGDLFFILMANMEVFYFAAFLTDYAKYSLIVASIILYVTGFADILCALAAGVVLQRASFIMGGKYRLWFLLGPSIVAPLFILQFSQIGGEYISMAIIILGFLASHLLWNVVFAASGALVGSLTQLPDERTILSSSRAQGMAAAGLIFSVTGPPMIAFFSKHTRGNSGLSITVAIFAVLMIVGYLYMYRITAVGDPFDNKVIKTGNKETGKTFKESAGLVFNNHPLLLLMIAEIFRNTSGFLIASFAFYYFGYVLNNPGFLSVFILACSVGGLLGAFAATWIGVRIGKRTAYWLFLILAGFTFGLASFFEANAWSFTIIFAVASMLGNVSGSMSTALFVDTVVYGEWKTGKNIQAFTMSLLTLPIKLGILLRSGVITVGLISIGFIANTTLAPEVTKGISAIMIYSPAVACAIAAAVFYFGYRIEDKHVLQMQDEIEVGKPFEELEVFENSSVWREWTAHSTIQLTSA